MRLGKSESKGHNIVYLLSSFLSHTHGKPADGGLVKNGRRGPDVVEPTVQRAMGFDLPYHRATTVGKQGMLTGPLQKGG